MKIPFSKYKTNGLRLTKVTGTKAYNNALRKDKDSSTTKTREVLDKAAKRYEEINGEPPPGNVLAPGLRIPVSTPSAAATGPSGKKISPKELQFWGKRMPTIDLPGLASGALGIDHPAIREYFEKSDVKAVTEAMQYAHNQKSIPAFYGKIGRAGPMDIIYRTIHREQFVRLDLALLFMLAGHEHGVALAKAIVVSDPSTIDVAFRVITKMKPIVSIVELATVLNLVSGVASELRLEHLVGAITPEEAQTTFGWFNTCDLLRKGATMVSVHLQSMSPENLTVFNTSLQDFFRRPAEDDDEIAGSPSLGLYSEIEQNVPESPEVALRGIIVSSRRDAMRAGMLVAGALDAACSIKSQDEARLNTLKNAIGGIVGGACGAGLMAGAIIAPLATAAVNAAFDAAWTSRDFKKAAHCLRAHLEVTKLNAGDLSESEGDLNADAGRYFHWINATVHALGYA